MHHTVSAPRGTDRLPACISLSAHPGVRTDSQHASHCQRTPGYGQTPSMHLTVSAPRGTDRAPDRASGGTLQHRPALHQTDFCTVAQWCSLHLYVLAREREHQFLKSFTLRHSGKGPSHRVNVPSATDNIKLCLSVKPFGLC